MQNSTLSEKEIKRIYGRILAQKKRLLVLYPYFGALSTQLPVELDETCETAYVDGVKIGVNPYWIDQYQDVQIMGILAHEIGHVSNGHHFGSVGRDPDKWNQACDLALNPVLIDEGFMLFDGFLFEEKYKGWSAEAIYFDLTEQEKQDKKNQNMDDQQEQSSAGSSGKPGNGTEDGKSDGQSKGEDRDNSDPSSENAHDDAGDQAEGNEPSGSKPSDDQEGSDHQGTGKGGKPTSKPANGNESTGISQGKPKSNVGQIRLHPDANKETKNAAVKSAAQYAHTVGKLSNGLKRIISESILPEVDYRSLTALFLAEKRRTDYRWNRPNPRFSHFAYLPALEEKRISMIYFVIDSSGSVSDFDLSCAQEALKQAIAQIRPERVIVVFADCEIQSVVELDEYTEIKLEGKGGGGTDFRPVFSAIENGTIESDGLGNTDQPAGLIYVTDLEGEFPKNPPDYPVLWLSTIPRKTAPFGEVVYLDHRTDNYH